MSESISSIDRIISERRLKAQELLALGKISLPTTALCLLLRALI